MDGASIAKRLASCNTTARNRAVRLLASWLSHNPSGDSSSSTAAVSVVSDGDLSRIWKGLFYCVWHADKLPAQLDLINRLASLLSALDRPLAVRYLEAFIVTVRREWSGIDHLRLDKFYLLIRRFLRHLFLLLSNTSWNPELSAQTIAVLSEKSLLAVDKSQGNGVSYFIAEAFLDEMLEFLPVPPETLEVLLSPFILAIERSTDRVLLSKIKVSIFDRLLDNGAKLLVLERSGGHAEPGSEVEKLGKIAFLMGFSKRFFDSGSAVETLQGNRKALFALHHSFLKLEKGLEKSGLSISIEGPENGNLVNVPVSVASDSSEQIEADSGRGGGESDGKPAKKRKKPKKSNGNPTEGADSVVSENSEQIEMGSGYVGVKSDGKPEKKRKKSRKSSGNLKEGADSVVLESSELIETGSGCGDNEQDDDPSKKKKKAKKSLTSVEKKSKTKNMSGSDKDCSVAVPLAGSDYVNGDITGAHNLIPLDEHVMSNLQKQFEKVAYESGMAKSDVTLPHPSSTPVATIPTKKRKRAKSGDRKNTVSPSSVNGGSITVKSGDKSAKKVRFSMKNNIVWKPQTPLPPQSLRLPPSATPRGSALKQGVPPGPVKETPLSMIRGKAVSRSIKRGRKGSKSGSPAIKRLRKLQCFSV